ncbi:putative protein phosphatase 2C 26 [Iris pallida]|uniref:Uncharacterized protein n=1 Tax=Iris pallida TaxID=29817 RepID=A0AAX6FK53_IRIPA|nr:putative protein phosphatase 2C 26 [Iris pallida]KAJ6827863.1 putative protein phosphatase 2C 26 [Iris pallida]
MGTTARRRPSFSSTISTSRCSPSSKVYSGRSKKTIMMATEDLAKKWHLGNYGSF